MADRTCRLCITRTSGSQRQARRTQMARGGRVRTPCQPLARSHGAGSAVPPATADGGRQLRSVTPLADPVSSISRQVLKSPWKPAWQHPRQHPHSQRPAGAVLVAGGRLGHRCCPRSSRVSVPLLGSGMHTGPIPRARAGPDPVELLHPAEPRRKHRATAPEYCY